MSRKEQAKAMYIAGDKPQKIAEELGYKSATISDWASKEGWSLERQKKTEEVASKRQEEIEKIINLSLTELKRLLMDESVKDKEKVAAINAALGISGLKKEKKEHEFGEGGVDVTINYKPVKRVKS